MKNCKSMLGILAFALAFTVGATAGDAPKLTFTFTKANYPERCRPTLMESTTQV